MRLSANEAQRLCLDSIERYLFVHAKLQVLLTQIWSINNVFMGLGIFARADVPDEIKDRHVEAHSYITGRHKVEEHFRQNILECLDDSIERFKFESRDRERGRVKDERSQR